MEGGLVKLLRSRLILHLEGDTLVREKHEMLD